MNKKYIIINYIIFKKKKKKKKIREISFLYNRKYKK